MVQRLLVAAVGVPLLIAVLCVAPPWAAAVFLALVCIVGAHELLTAVCGEKIIGLTALAGLMSVGVIVSVYLTSAPELAETILPQLSKWILLIPVLLTLFAVVLMYGRGGELSFLDECTVMVAGLVIPMALACLLRLRMLPHGNGLVLIPLVSAFCSDSLALFAGMLMGKHKLAPLVSPKKTVEGAVGGLVGGMLGMVIFRVIYYFCTVYPLHIGWCLLLGLVGAVMGQLGDLSFSVVKRQYGIKDYGRLLPGHGGVLDRFDSVIFAAPLIWMIISVVEI